jgi:hypothetical protein
MPVGLSPAAALTIKSKSVAISIGYLNLSTKSSPPKTAGAAGYLPNDLRLISAGVRLATRNFLHLPIQVFALRAGSIVLWERGVVGVVQVVLVKRGKVSGAADSRKKERARTE